MVRSDLIIAGSNFIFFHIKDNYSKLSDLCDQIFDYFNLTIYDFESKIDTNFSIDSIKNKLETFSDKHFKSALIEFTNEIQNLKNHFPEELHQLEKISEEIKNNFNNLVDHKVFDQKIIKELKKQFEFNLKKLI